MTFQEALATAHRKSLHIEDEFYVYEDTDPSTAGRYFVLSGTSRDLGYGGVDDITPIACYSAGAIVS